MAATLIQRSPFLGTGVPFGSVRSAAPCAESQTSHPGLLPIVRSHSVSDPSKPATTAQRRSQESVAAFQATNAQDVTLLGSTSSQAFETFWDNVLSEGGSKARTRNGAVEGDVHQQTQASPQSRIGKEDWRAVRRVVDFDSKKAKELRRKLRETENFHDTFYHRLAQRISRMYLKSCNDWVKKL